MIPQEVINQIIEKVNIAEVIAEYIPVLPDGTGFKSVCPFHNDTNPSMKISPSKKIFKCHSLIKIINSYSIHIIFITFS